MYSDVRTPLCRHDVTSHDCARIEDNVDEITLGRCALHYVVNSGPRFSTEQEKNMCSIAHRTARVDTRYTLPCLRLRHCSYIHKADRPQRRRRVTGSSWR